MDTEHQTLPVLQKPKTVFLIYSLSHDCVLDVVGRWGTEEEEDTAKVVEAIAEGYKKHYPGVKSKRVALS
jgi:hypothetical protein